MIPANEALLLPTARLSEEERTAADKLDAEIDLAIRANMERRGMDMKCKETNANVVAEINRRLVRAKYKPQWKPISEPHPLNKALLIHTGWNLSIAPTDLAYDEADLAERS